jgi:hypothetical protein
MNLKTDVLSILARDPELFGNIEGEEIDAPLRIHWEALDQQVFIIHQVHGDLAGYILALSSDSDEEIYDKVDKIAEISANIVEKFLKNFSEQLDLNFFLDEPKICPATQNFSVEREFGHELINFQKKRKFLKALKTIAENSGGIQLEKAFKFNVKGLNLKFYFCLNASDIRNLNQ